MREMPSPTTDELGPSNRRTLDYPLRSSKHSESRAPLSSGGEDSTCGTCLGGMTVETRRYRIILFSMPPPLQTSAVASKVYPTSVWCIFDYWSVASSMPHRNVFPFTAAHVHDAVRNPEVVLTRNQEHLSTLNPAHWHTYDTIRQGPTHQDPKFWIFVIACTLRRFSLFRVSAASVPSARFQVGTPSRRHLLSHLDRPVRSVT